MAMTGNVETIEIRRLHEMVSNCDLDELKRNCFTVELISLQQNGVQIKSHEQSWHAVLKCIESVCIISISFNHSGNDNFNIRQGISVAIVIVPHTT